MLSAADAGGELELLVETIAGVVPCPDCGAVARAKDRFPVWVRDLPIGSKPVRCWRDGDIAEAHRSAIAPFVDWLRNRVGPVRTGVRGAR